MSRRSRWGWSKIGLVVGATGVFMGMFIPIAGWIERGYIGVFGVLFLVALVKGFVHIRAVLAEGSVRRLELSRGQQKMRAVRSEA